MSRQIRNVFLNRGILKYVIFLALLAALLGARPACRPPANLDCDDFYVTVGPDGCVTITNPCSEDGSWSEVDHFRLYQEPDGLYIRGRDVDGTCERDICALESVADFEDERVSYLYTKINRRRRPDYGEGFVYITTVVDPGIVVTATADPTLIQVGDSAMLKVSATGGIEPYHYWWTSDPDGQIEFSERAKDSLWVYPDLTAMYSVTATDHYGDEETDSVQVSVGMEIEVSASPDTIDVGGSSQLEAVVIGGTEPYSFSWVPLGSIDNSTIWNPTASPDVTTFYHVTVSDAGTNMDTDSITVYVRLSAQAYANLPSITLGDSTQLNVNVEGGRGPYTFSWSPAASLSADDVAQPYAKPTETTTYEVEVSGVDGMIARDSVTVEVSGGLVACFTWSPTEPERWEAVWFDPTCSQGNIVAWLWWLGLSEGTPPDGEPDDSLSVERTYDTMYETVGEHIVKLKVYDDQGNSDEMIDTITVVPQ